MTHLNWKLIFVDKPVFYFSFYEREQLTSYFNHRVVTVKNRNSIINFLARDKPFCILSGRNYVRMVVNEQQVGMKFESICLTKRIGKKMHLYNKVQKKKQSERK